ncbi:S46 family peptidase [Bacteroidota bacterium]
MVNYIKSSLLIYLLLVLFSVPVNAQYSIYETIDLDKVEFSFTDFGTMWTFDSVPLDFMEETYGFRPTEEWLEHVRKSALQFGNGCSAAFVSADGLIMTNHHCGRGRLIDIQLEGENLLKDGFYAPTLEEERVIPNLFVDQLLLIEDITKDIQDVMNEGKTDDEKVELKNAKIDELIVKYTEDTGLTCRVVTLYNGRKYSLYGYKRYNDIRLVMSPDFQIAATGWDWDNFTYPRYELDFAFYRAYDENGEPVKSDHHFTWSKTGAEEDELIFTVGRPGRTNRLNSVAELKYMGEKRYSHLLLAFNEVYKVYYELFNKYTDRESELLNAVMGRGNARKSYAGSLLGLRDEYVMAKKKDFEKKIKKAVNADPELNEKYGHIWNSLEVAVDELTRNADESDAYTIRSFARSVYYEIAQDIIKYAKQMRLAEDDREESFKEDMLEETLQKIIDKAELSEYESELAFKMVRAHVNYVSTILGDENELVKRVYGGNMDEEGAKYMLGKSALTSKTGIEMLLKQSPDDILNSEDPFIFFLQNTTDKLAKLRRLNREIQNTIDVNNQMLGEAVAAVFGDKISPDATSTLRISDGVIKPYEYNGTIAPGKTTYYGLWDRWASFNKKLYPWGLHPRWQKVPPELDLETPIGFASTNDIVGGNSGSSVINTKGEVVGLVHDGNLESLAGAFIYLPENNRCVATDAIGLIKALKYIYKTDKLVNEILTGKL